MPWSVVPWMKRCSLPMLSTRSTPKNVRSVCSACCPMKIGISTSTATQAGKSAARGGRAVSSPAAAMATNGSGVIKPAALSPTIATTITVAIDNSERAPVSR